MFFSISLLTWPFHLKLSFAVPPIPFWLSLPHSAPFNRLYAECVPFSCARWHLPLWWLFLFYVHCSVQFHGSPFLHILLNCFGFLFIPWFVSFYVHFTEFVSDLSANYTFLWKHAFPDPVLMSHFQLSLYLPRFLFKKCLTTQFSSWLNCFIPTSNFHYLFFKICWITVFLSKCLYCNISNSKACNHLHLKKNPT